MDSLVEYKRTNDALKPAWILGFNVRITNLFPRLFPRFAFDTRLLLLWFYR